MGFLTGAYGKLMAGKLVRQLQVQMTFVQSRLRKATRDAGNMDKFITSQQRMAETQVRSVAIQHQQGNSYWRTIMMGGITMPDSNLAATNPEQYRADSMAYTSRMGDVQAQLSMMQQNQSMVLEQKKSEIADYFETLREMQLQPLKDLEDDLQAEKDNLESRVKIAEAEYEARKKEEQASVKQFAPEYTGGGQG
ncbi:MAG: hypothetical protein LBK53_07100 [Heliobacteriaceae bacterium]|jgi:dTDP-4-amino-4,6-dideoxygalactose transaminase|nr:hypothetical protein [Heliobacteriaceae bacterium]